MLLRKAPTALNRLSTEGNKLFVVVCGDEWKIVHGTTPTPTGGKPTRPTRQDNDVSTKTAVTLGYVEGARHAAPLNGRS